MGFAQSVMAGCKSPEQPYCSKKPVYCTLTLHIYFTLGMHPQILNYNVSQSACIQKTSGIFLLRLTGYSEGMTHRSHLAFTNLHFYSQHNPSVLCQYSHAWKKISIVILPLIANGKSLMV